MTIPTVPPAIGAARAAHRAALDALFAPRVATPDQTEGGRQTIALAAKQGAVADARRKLADAIADQVAP